MARAGQRIEHPITGDYLIFHQTAEDTAGALLRIEEVKSVDFKGPPPHYHPRQQERFEVLEGTAQLKINGQAHILQAGQSLSVPPGAIHTWSNGGNTQVRIITEFRPALRIENFFESLYLLPYIKHTDNLARPALFQMALLSLEYESYLPGIPMRLQKLLFLLLKPTALLFGYRARYTEKDIPAGVSVKA